jgi:hypothetical protein
MRPATKPMTISTSTPTAIRATADVPRPGIGCGWVGPTVLASPGGVSPGGTPPPGSRPVL